MAYLGNQPSSVAFLTDTLSGTGIQTAFTLSAAPANTSSILVMITGVVQDPSQYVLNGTTLVFSAAPPAGIANISVRYLGVPASSVINTAYRTVTEFTAIANQTLFLPPAYRVGYVDVYRNGALLGSADYTANGLSVVLLRSANAGDIVTVESFYVSSILNSPPGYGIPTGVITLWYGTSATAPSGWYICDGANGTPDMRGFFAIGASAVFPQGTTGGSADAIIPLHSHGITDPGHLHSINIPTSGSAASGAGATSLAAVASANTTTSTTNITINNAGQSPTNANLPPYRALIYIMKA